MSYFNILRDRHNKFIGFNVDGYTAKSWEDLQRIAKARIDCHDPSWDEIEIDGDEMQTEAERLQQIGIEALQAEIESLKRLNDKQGIELAQLGNTLISLKAQNDNYTNHFERLKTDALDRLRAIKMLVSASIRNCDIGLNHHVRDERLKHLHDVLDTQVSELGCLTLHTYDDDF